MNRIKELREEKRMTQSDLAMAMGYTKMTISRYESENRELTSDTINRLCEIFGVTSDYLLCRSDNPAPQISAEDLALLRAYRAASERDRSLVDQILQPAAAHEVRAAG